METVTTIGELATYLEGIAPLHLQESYDNAGLLTGNPNEPVRGVLTALDMLEPVVDEAVRLGCNVVVAHHPIIFKGLKRLVGAHYVERVVIKAIRSGIALYAIHTNLDSVLENGVNQRIGQMLGLESLRILEARPGDTTGIAGMGAVGELAAPMYREDFLTHLKSCMGCSVVRHTEGHGREVRRVAVCGGAGSFLIQAALHAGVDAFVTADLKYHEFFEADGRVLLADIGHYESEQGTIRLLKELIDKNFRNFATHCTTLCTNPVKYA